MFPQSENAVLHCASSLRQRYPSTAATLVERQIGWSKNRGAQHEAEFWSAVLKRINETATVVSQIHVLQRASGNNLTPNIDANVTIDVRAASG